jgi:hypothetical protein
VSAERDTSHLSEPGTPSQLAGLPTHTYTAGTMFARSHGRAFGAWWFANNGDGRFDLAGPHGTCYVAEDEVITLLEKFGGMVKVPSYSIEDTAISSMTLAADLVVADLTNNRAVAFGVSSEAFAAAGYPLTQRWATALHTAGFAGARYWARHDLEHTHRAIAIFDAAGAPTDPGAHSVVSTAALTDRSDLLERWHDETGVTILDIPSL